MTGTTPRNFNTKNLRSMIIVIGLSFMLGCTSLNSDSDITGFSVVASTGQNYAGPYVEGLWFDKTEKTDKNETGFGIKFDIAFGDTVRPLGIWWEKDFWITDKRIRDIPLEEWNEYFGQDLATRLRKINPEKYKNSVYNPWFAKHFMVVRIPRFVPSLFFSLGTPIFSFYIGNKSYDCDAITTSLPYAGNDTSWTNEEDEKKCKKNDPPDTVRYLCPSIRSTSSR